MIVHREFGQHSQQWIEARAGIVTASEADQLITPTGEIRKGDMPKRLLATKLAEKWFGPLPQYGSWAMGQGEVLEEQAIPYYSFTYSQVEQVGFITNDEKTCGCSPDGLLSGDCGLEIKCLQPVHHVACLLDGKLPKDYFAQVHFSMFVTGFSNWKLFLYSRQSPKLVIDVKRDALIQDKIGSALQAFNHSFYLGWNKLLELNGGNEPPKREPMVFSMDIKDDRFDILH